MSDALDLAVRAFALPADPAPASPRRKQRRGGRPPAQVERFPPFALVFDTETTTDATQRLIFGAWRYCRVIITGADVAFECVAEGLFYADELPDRDPSTYRTLVGYAAREAAWTADAGGLDASPRLTLEPARRWLDRVFWRAAYELRAAVICFNAPFDLSRIAWRAGPVRTFKPGQRVDAFEGGFSLALWSHGRDGRRLESRYRPRLAIKSIDSKRSLKGFRAPNLSDSENLTVDGQGERRTFTGH